MPNWKQNKSILGGSAIRVLQNVGLLYPILLPLYGTGQTNGGME